MACHIPSYPGCSRCGLYLTVTYHGKDPELVTRPNYVISDEIRQNSLV